LARLLIREIKREDMRDIMDIVMSAKFDFPSGFMYNVDEINEEILWNMYKSRKDFPTLVAVYGDKVIALATTMRHWDEENNFYIMLLLTHSKYRGLGAGTMLIKECFKLAVSKGFEILSLHTWASNKAMNLYSRLGFVWIPHTSVYMINFLPQLFKHSRIKSLFRDPLELISSLRNPPEKVFVNDHVAWKYVIDSSKGIIEAIFDSESKRLLSIRIGSDYGIKLTPPRKEYYVKNQDLEVVIEAVNPVVAKINDELKLLNKGLNKVILKAKSDNDIIIDNFKFGYKLRVRDPVELKIPKKPFSTPSNVSLLIKCNVDEIDDNLAIICDEGLNIVPNEVKVHLKKNESMLVNLSVEGQGKAVFRIGDKEEEFYFFKGDLVRVRDDGLESLSWKITREELSPVINDFNIWYNIILCNRNIFLKFNKVDKSFVSKTEEAIIKLKPRISGDYLEAIVEITALRDIDDELSIIFWLESKNPETSFIIPISDKYYVQEKFFYPAFPKSYSLYRFKLPKPFIGYEAKGHNIIIEFDKDALYTLGYSPFDVELTYNIKLKRGEKLRKTIRITINKDLTKLLGMERKRHIESKIEGDELVIKNNWLKPISLEIIFDNIGGKIELEPEQIKRYTILRSGLGEIELKIKIGPLIERRVLKYVIPEKVVWENLTTEYKDMKIELTRRGASPRIIDIDREPLIFWSDEKIKTPTRFPIIHGGIILKIREENEDLNLHLLDWDYEGNGKFKISIRDLVIRRSWLILGKNRILEVLEIENKRKDSRDISISHMINLSEEIKIASNKRFSIGNEMKVLRISDKSKLKVELSNLKLNYQLLASKDQRVSAMQILNMHGIIQSTWSWNLLPGEKKRAYCLLEVELIKQMYRSST